MRPLHGMFQLVNKLRAALEVVMIIISYIVFNLYDQSTSCNEQ